MRDVLEERLAARLRDLGDTVPDELVPPADLELQVKRRRSRKRATTRWLAFAIAAGFAASLVTVAVVHGTVGTRPVAFSRPSPYNAPHDSLRTGAVMLAARGRDVVVLDATGHTLDTMIHANRGDIQYARVTVDHRALWYLSLKHARTTCGDVVRADIEGRSSAIVTHAVAFDVSPDGTRLALYGAGDLARDHCTPTPTAGRPTHIVVVDLASSTSSSLPATDVTSLQWSPDGSYLVSAQCSRGRCKPLDRIDVPRDLRLSLIRRGGFAATPASGSIAGYGPDGLYVLENAKRGTTVDVFDPQTLEFSAVRLATTVHWKVSQVVGTTAGTFVVAQRVGVDKDPGLYRVDNRRLVLVRDIDPGVLTGVAPLSR